MQTCNSYKFSLPESSSLAWWFPTYRWVSQKQIITAKPKVIIRTHTQDIFRFISLSTLISQPTQTNLFLVPFFYRAYLPSYRNNLQRFEPRTYSWGCVPCPAMSSLKETTLVPKTFFHCGLFPRYINHFHRESNTGQFSWILAFVSVIFSSKQTTMIFAMFFCLLSYRTTGTALTGTRTRRFSGVLTTYVLFLVPRNKPAKCGANRFIRFRA